MSLLLSDNKNWGGNRMGILSGNPKEEPLHYGEVFSAWTYLHNLKGTIAQYQTLQNHAGDKELKALLDDLVKNVGKEQVKQVEDLLKVNGIGLPPTPPERPSAAIESIPVGAKVNDQEIANIIAANISAGLVACSTAIGQCVREDVAAMFAQFHATKVQYGLRVLRLNKEKGWLIPPPLHLKTPELVNV